MPYIRKHAVLSQDKQKCCYPSHSPYIPYAEHFFYLRKFFLFDGLSRSECLSGTTVYLFFILTVFFRPLSMRSFLFSIMEAGHRTGNAFRTEQKLCEKKETQQQEIHKLLYFIMFCWLAKTRQKEGEETQKKKPKRKTSP